MATNDKEIWKPVTHIKGPTVKKYLISSRGRLASYDNDINEKYILKLHSNGGFPMSTVHVDGKSKALFAHHAIAHAFLKKTSPKQVSIIHLDYNKANNAISNLKWVTKKEQIEHSKKSPFVIESNARKVYNGATARKLDEKKVISLKKEIWNPKRKASLKQIAAKYGIAEMNLYRIKKGEMWFHVHVEGEPVFPKYKAQLKNIEFHAKQEAKEKLAKEKRKAAYIEKLKISTEKRKKQEAEKKARQEKLIKRRKEKAIERIAIEKRKLARASAAKKVKEKHPKKILKEVNSKLELKKNKKTKSKKNVVVHSDFKIVKIKKEKKGKKKNKK